MENAIWIVTLAATVITVTALAGKLQLPAPLLLMVVGIGASFVPWVPEVQLSPEVVLLGLLPPLLYAVAIRSSIVDFRAQAAAIGLLSVALVVLTALGIGVLVWLLLPVPFAAAFALGAVVSPPDAVAATAVARRVGLPRRVITLLEGESLFNDATAITCLRVAILALAAGAGAGGITAGEVGLAFLIAAGGGVLIGVVVAVLAGAIRRRVTSARLDNAISLLLPFTAYLPAEKFGYGGFHASGVIAVVTAGLIIGNRAPVIQTARSRISERTNWATIQFLLENAVFLLIGLQARWIIRELFTDDVGPGAIALVCAAALGGVIIIRLAFVSIARLVLLRRDAETDRRGKWAESLLVGWAGMRGVVTLAAAFILPAQTPHRPVLVFVAMVVTAGTLLLQGLTLPVLARHAGLRSPDPREDALQAASVLQASSRAALAKLDEITDPTTSPETIDKLRERITRRTNEMWEHLRTGSEVETPAEEYRRLRLRTLQAERDEVLRVRAKGKIDHDVIDKVLYSLDVEESMLTVLESHTEEVSNSDPLTAPEAFDACEHLREAPHVVPPAGSGICEDCVREGTRPVHLRLCLTCGNVGCCDSSVGRHGRRHWEQTGHPVLRSFEQGEKWRWCFIDERLG